jgi:hypothetical protein
VYEELVAAFPTAVSAPGSSCSYNRIQRTSQEVQLQLHSVTTCAAGAPWYATTSCKQLSCKVAQFDWQGTPSA